MWHFSGVQLQETKNEGGVECSVVQCEINTMWRCREQESYWSLLAPNLLLDQEDDEGEMNRLDNICLLIYKHTPHICLHAVLLAAKSHKQWCVVLCDQYAELLAQSHIWLDELLWMPLSLGWVMRHLKVFYRKTKDRDTDTDILTHTWHITRDKST